MPHYFVIYKPFGILSQFSGEKDTLKNVGEFPKDAYPVGRLDKDSEGLLLITNDKSLNHLLLNPGFGHQRTYWVQVEGIPDPSAMDKLQNGVSIKADGKPYFTKKTKVSILQKTPDLPQRNPPIRYRKNVPDTWLSITLTEGKNRQVRKMTAATGFPTLRLVRWSIEDLDIGGFKVGESREYSRDELYKLLKIDQTVKNQNRKGIRSFQHNKS